MTTKSTLNVTRAVWLTALSLAAAGHVVGVQEPDAPVAEFPPTVFRVPIEGTVDLGMAPFVARIVEEASEVQGAVVLLDIDTFGGRVDAAVLIRDALIDAPVRTVAFIHPARDFGRRAHFARVREHRHRAGRIHRRGHSD